MATLLEDVETFIIANGLATADGVDIFRDFSPDAPDDVIALYEYSGNPPTKGVDCYVRSIQVTTRSLAAATAQSKANALFAVLKQAEESITQLTASRAVIIATRQPPYKISIDANKRLIYGFNIAITTSSD